MPAQIEAWNTRVVDERIIKLLEEWIDIYYDTEDGGFFNRHILAIDHLWNIVGVIRGDKESAELLQKKLNLLKEWGEIE